VSRPCELVGLARSSYYYAPAGDSPEKLLLMRLIDEQYTRTPFYGIPRMTAWLRSCGYQVNHKRVARLMRLMGLEAVYPKPPLSQGAGGHRLYPYLLHGVVIAGPNHVWRTDSTYIRLLKGFVYLVAILDWYSRYVVSWELSNTLDVSFCLTALERALVIAQPEIFNSDHGVQFTSHAFTSRLEGAGIRVSMDGRGRAFDNIFIERLWRTVKYEAVYTNDYESVPAVVQGLTNYGVFYNHERLHQALHYQLPAAVYYQRA
jgi:putative transposase